MQSWLFPLIPAKRACSLPEAAGRAGQSAAYRAAAKRGRATIARTWKTETEWWGIGQAAQWKNGKGMSTVLQLFLFTLS